MGRTALALVFVLSLNQIAKAELTYLSCTGMAHTGASSPDEPWSLSLIIDTARKTVTVDDYDPVQLLGDSQNIVGFMPFKTPSDYGVSTGTLNRITGRTRIHILPSWGGLQVFEGVCKVTQKLF